MPFEDTSSFLFGLNQFASPPGNSPSAGGAGTSALNSRHDSLLTGLESFGESAPGANSDDSLLGQGTFADQLALWTNANFSFDGPTGHALLADDDKDKDKDGDLDAGREADEADRRRAQARAENRDTEAALFQRQREASERRADDERHHQHNHHQVSSGHDQHRASQPNTAPPTPLINQQQNYFGGAAPGHQQHARRPSELQAHNAASPTISQAQFAAQLQAQLQNPFPVNNPFWNGAGSPPNPLQALLYQQQPQHPSQLPGQVGAPHARPPQQQSGPAGNLDLNTLLALQQALTSINNGNGQPASAQVSALLGQLSNPQVQAALSQLQQPQHQSQEHGQFSHQRPSNGSVNFDLTHAQNGIANGLPQLPIWQASGSGPGAPHAPEFPPAPNGASHGPGPNPSRQASFNGRHNDTAPSSADEDATVHRNGGRQSGKKKPRTSPESGQGDSSDNARERANSIGDAAGGAGERDDIPPLQLIDTGNPEADAEANRLAIEEDKRRRNTAASARFRVKKKQREAALEATSRELRNRLAELEQENSRLRTENGWLKGLIHVKPEQGPTAGSASATAGGARTAASTANGGNNATSSFVPRGPSAQAQGTSNGDTTVSRLRNTGLHPRGVGTETTSTDGSVAGATTRTTATTGAALTTKGAAPAPAVVGAGGTKRDRED